MKKIILILILLLTVTLIVGCSRNPTGKTVADSIADSNTNSIADIKIPLSSLSGTVQFYTYNDGGVQIKYFAVLGSDGQPRTAFDACDVCKGFKGYQQRGTDIVCRNCGKVFSIDGLGTKNTGYGCWPSYLPHTVKDGNVLIKISDIRSGRNRFTY